MIKLRYQLFEINNTCRADWAITVQQLLVVRVIDLKNDASLSQLYYAYLCVNI